MKIPKLGTFKLPYGFDWSLFLVPLVLTILSIVIIYSITFATNPTVVISQIVYVVIGFAIALVLSLLDYRLLRGFSFFLYAIVLILLIFVGIFGKQIFGASRWIDLGFFQLQPSELAKLTTLLFLSRFFAEKEEFRWKDFFLLLIISAVPIAFILFQPDFGTAMIIFVTFLGLLAFSKFPKFILILVCASLIVAAPLGWHFLKDYQKQRIYTFINPSSDPYGSGYNVAQAKITVGSGGLWGQGIGRGTQIQLNFLPVAHSDFIFASIAESLGFFGSSILLILMFYLIARIIALARVAKDSFGFYIAIGWGITLLFEIFVNVGMNMGIMPVTGIPLPFVSAGGSALITNMAAIGILQSIYLRHRKITF